MSIINQYIGPKSKYDDSLPYTYEARVPVIEGEDDYNSYISDTICGLVRYLQQNNVTSDEVTIYEIYKTEEKVIEKKLCTNDHGNWLKKSDICKSFQEHYKGHVVKGGCSFQDRDANGVGP
ncbi:MAG: hypothetical protein OQL09_06450 [Gammaproteobacteria bacterium]|nr:hypothetical protein [Gammaproteobacteria bacterium]